MYYTPRTPLLQFILRRDLDFIYSVARAHEVELFDCEALDASSAGEYDITVSGGVSEHYDFVYQSGTLTVTALSDMPWVATDGTLVYYAQGNLHVSAGVGRLLISDLSGAEVKRVIAPRSIVSLDELPAGQYIVVVESDDRSVSRYRFIKK